MSEGCPNCGQLTNASCSRLIEDTCGHKKCRICLLYEEQGCKICEKEQLVPSIIDCQYDEKICKSPSIILDISNSNSTKLIKRHNNNEDGDQCDKYTDLNINISSASVNAQEEKILNTEGKKLNNLKSDLLDSEKNSDVLIGDDNFLNSDKATVGETKSIVDKNKKVKQKKLDRSHIIVIPGNPEQYKCNICNKIFRNKKGKCYHDVCITGIRPYKCKICDRTFVKKSHYEYHERVHTGYKPFKCSLCDKAFPQKNKLNRHMLTHSTEKQFVCTKCDKRYSKKDNLKIHMMVHSGTLPYSCDSCGKSFRLRANLNRHIFIHSSERPYKCEFCEKSFKDKSLLSRHRRTHSKERPYSCAHCSRVFLSKSELRRHLTIHTDVKPFNCNICNTVFRRKDNLNRHVRHHHSEDASTPVATAAVSPKEKIKVKKKVNKSREKGKSKSVLKNKEDERNEIINNINTVQNIISRCDARGNIYPVIRATGELSNAVSVINGPISKLRAEDKGKIVGEKKKVLTYTEPISSAEAIVINQRIEEKLYSINQSPGTCYYRDCNSSRINDASHVGMGMGLGMSVLPPLRHNSPIRAVPRYEKRLDGNFSPPKSTSFIELKSTTDCKTKGKSECHPGERKSNINDREGVFEDGFAERANCVSTIQKNVGVGVEVEGNKEPKGFETHWRRRTLENLKPHIDLN
ncbi:putative zinc finger protein 66 [Microplitis demolitor]|uniref:putative zinc finger protein 66 n=1 Tax=Microplitis demolitor TaxID=69319 RepID=UPI0004CCE709|nr:putative zinc finger protein 66 [Microplitis demolitor]